MTQVGAVESRSLAQVRKEYPLLFHCRLISDSLEGRLPFICAPS